MAEKKYVKTPLMTQYYDIKEKHPDAVLLFRVGDFYETFGEDAIRAAKILGITLTQRANGKASSVELAGFPYHALDTYLPKLVRAGQRVAICEQLEDPKTTKKIVKRGVTELVTPGVSLNDNVLEHSENNFLACVHFNKRMVGIAFLDISTGEFFVSQGSAEYIDKLLSSFQPKEILVERSTLNQFKENFGFSYYTYKLDDWIFREDTAQDRLTKQFGTLSLKGFGISDMKSGIIAAGAIIHYLDLTCHENNTHVRSISRIEEDKYVWLDKFSIRNLELFSSISDGGKTLIEVIDRTISPMGGRLVRRWLALPLKNPAQIKERQDVVEYLINDEKARADFSTNIKATGDLERLISKVATARINPREMSILRNSLTKITPLKELCEISGIGSLRKIGDQLNPCSTALEKMIQQLGENPPVALNKGNVIAEGVSAELDEYREILQNGKQYIEDLKNREIERTGITSLKISFNNVFGYYIEVRNTHKDKVPEEWIRKQTLVSAERYITEELKEFENKVLSAEERILAIESNLFNTLVLSIVDYIPAIQLNASLIAQLDCLISFATVAIENNYNRPDINESEIIDIKQGRHPVIERQLPDGEPYIPNDVYLDNVTQQMIIITGPNMSGKSALLRQTALIVLLAQTGCFVPAESASFGYVDKIFTRVGASDNISQGESTFMVEMSESASILNNLSDRSLVLLDEIGRGTSTYDGISIAWAMAEYIHENPKRKAKTLFATHYHELNEMEKSFKRIKNYNVSIKEVDKKVVFLRKLIRGGSEHSFGIHVAKMAGMPRSIVARANEILKQLEKGEQKNSLSKPVADIADNREGMQLSFFQLDDPVLSQISTRIKGLDINNLTPVQALNILSEIQALTGK